MFKLRNMKPVVPCSNTTACVNVIDETEKLFDRRRFLTDIQEQFETKELCFSIRVR